MSVRTESTNPGALRFYRKAGFVPMRQRVAEVEGTEVEVWELEREL